MREDYYILQSGELKRKHNTVYFENVNMKKPIPIERINAIYCLGQITTNSSLLNYLSQNKIVVHFFNYYGYYSGSYYPREHLLSGSLLVEQVRHYIDDRKRVAIAKEMVTSTLENLNRVLLHYKKHGKEVSGTIENIKEATNSVDTCSRIQELMQIEGSVWKEYYGAFGTILRRFKFKSRKKRPPDNEVNCMISFMNSLLYTATLTEIYHTQLNPTISYLHEPFERRFSLALDIAEMFKPLIVGRALFKLVNKGEIKEEHFRRDVNSCLLNENGRRKVLKEFDERLKIVVDHPDLKRKVSQRRLLRLEGYKLVKHLMGGKGYKGFRIWW